MPELPEVEVTRLSFADRIVGATVLSLTMGKALRWPLGHPPESVKGRQVRAVRRRGKYLLLDLDQGMVLVHMGMSGSLSFSTSPPPPGPHDHMDLATTQGTLRLHDPRRFGAVVYAETEDAPAAQKLLGRLGTEPLSDDFDAVRFRAALSARKVPIKQVLLAGNVVVGVGNIYASEALFLARIRPTTLASRLGPVRAARLHAAIREVLAKAVASGGSTLRDFKSADGQVGHFQIEAMVYGREGAPCRVCGNPIQMLRQGQRATYFCTRCQRA